jgi:hypothetical protein
VLLELSRRFHSAPTGAGTEQGIRIRTHHSKSELQNLGWVLVVHSLRVAIGNSVVTLHV